MRNMKKVLAFALSAVLVASLAACGGDTAGTTTGTTEGTSEGTTAGTSADSTETSGSGEAGALKTGLSVLTKIGSSKEAGDEDGLAQVDSTVVAVLVDADGKLVDIEIDAAQTKANFDSTGKVTTDLATEYKTKVELGDDYGMRKNSDIGKEWNEQAAFFADSIKGMNASEVSGIELDDEGRVTDTDMLSGVTVHVNEMMDVVAKALAN